MTASTYTESGVDTRLGDICSRIMYAASKRTWANRKGLLGEISVPLDDFSGSRYMDFSGLRDTVLQMNFDGVGTKIEIAERLSENGDFSFHRGIAFDLFAMVCDDAVCRGGEPISFGSILEISRLNKTLIENLAEGMVEAAKTARVAVVNGEIAEVGPRISGYGPHAYNWGATVLWAAGKQSLINPRSVKPGDAVVGLREKGFRSNGFSLARKIMLDIFGERWHTTPEGRKVAAELLTSSTIYCRPVIRVLESLPGKVSGIAHITGGGLAGKLLRMLRIPGLGAKITSPFEPNKTMLQLQQLGDVEDAEAYRTWNMGTGMAIFTSAPGSVIDILKKTGIEAREIGAVVSDKGLRIKNKGHFAEKEEMFFSHEGR